MLVYGKNVAKEILSENKTVKKAYLQNNFKDNDIFDLLDNRSIPIVYYDKDRLNKLTDALHQGIVLEVEDYKYYDEKKMLGEINESSFIVILDHLEDPHNFGAIIRTCEAAGVDFIIIPKDRSVKVKSTVIKISTGAIENVKIVSVTNLNKILEKLKKTNVWIVGTSLEKSVDYTKVDYKTATALVIGNEGKGISDLVKKNCDFVVKIPMIGKTNSLNASVAAGIMIYEVIRQRMEL